MPRFQRSPELFELTRGSALGFDELFGSKTSGAKARIFLIRGPLLESSGNN